MLAWLPVCLPACLPVYGTAQRVAVFDLDESERHAQLQGTTKLLPHLMSAFISWSLDSLNLVTGTLSLLDGLYVVIYVCLSVAAYWLLGGSSVISRGHRRADVDYKHDSQGIWTEMLREMSVAAICTHLFLCLLACSYTVDDKIKYMYMCTIGEMHFTTREYA